MRPKNCFQFTPNPPRRVRVPPDRTNVRATACRVLRTSSDLIVGASGNSAGGGSNTGRAYVFSGEPSGGSCCVGVTGNIDCDPSSVVDIADLTVLIDHLFISLTPLCCREQGNIDGDLGAVVDIADLTFLIDHLFITLVGTSACQ